MEVRIGVSQSVKELEVELADADRATVMADITKALAVESGILWLTDRKGRTVGVPSAKVAYVEIGSASDDRKVGFAR
jgi:hypothetical protein